MPLCLGTSEKEREGGNVQLVETPTDEKFLSLQTDLNIKKHSIIILKGKVGET